MPPQGRGDIGEIVGPNRSRIAGQRLPARIGGQRTKIVGAAGHHDPNRGNFPTIPAAADVPPDACRQPGIGGQIAQERLQVEIAAGNMDRQQPPRFQTVEVDLQGLAGREVNGHGVGAVDVDDQQIELPLGPMFEREPRIAQDDLGLAAAIGQIAEVVRVPRDPFHGRVDLIEREPLARLGIGGDRADAQAQHADLGQRPARLEHVEDRSQAVPCGDNIPAVRAAGSRRDSADRGSWCRAAIGSCSIRDRTPRGGCRRNSAGHRAGGCPFPPTRG